MPENVLDIRDVTKVFERKGQPNLRAVDGVSFSVGRGECVGLVGGSGCGKTTIARLVTRLIEPTSGSIALNGRDIHESADGVQMVFQNPAASFDPRRTLGQGAAEALINAGMPKPEARKQVVALFERCGLPADFVGRYAYEVSGGQCQRAAIARALAPDPSLIVLDEATSALDVTVQAQIVSLLRDVRAQRSCAYLFICHDLALVQGFCDRVLVMWRGRIVEEGPPAEVIASPKHPYTCELLEAAFV